MKSLSLWKTHLCRVWGARGSMATQIVPAFIMAEKAGLSSEFFLKLQMETGSGERADGQLPCSIGSVKVPEGLLSYPFKLLFIILSSATAALGHIWLWECAH